MDDPITKEDLYGTSEKKTPPSPLPVEETPEIPMDVPADQSRTDKSGQEPPPSLPPVGYLPKRHTSSPVRGLGKIVLFVLLFAVGIWLSSFVRQYFPGSTDNNTLTPTPKVLITPGVGVSDSDSPTPASSSAWKSYPVTSGSTKLPIQGVSVFLPSDVLSPICDGVNCASQGTYLPGGTRFTVAPRGAGQILPDFRGTVISDVGGVTFTTKPVSLAGRQAMEFTGVFSGRTVSGYAFSKMRGVMIPVSATMSIELNHFVPSGITANFEADDQIFDQIVQRLVLPDAADKGAILVTGTPTVTPAQQVSPSVSLTPTPSPIESL